MILSLLSSGWRSLHARLHSFIASESFLLSPQAENEKQTGRKVKIFKVERVENSLIFFIIFYLFLTLKVLVASLQTIINGVL